MNSKKVAKCLSVILGPYLWLPILFTLIIFKTGLSSNQIRILFPTILILQVIIPLLYLFLGPTFGWISSWEMKIREERKPFLILVFVSSLMSLVAIYLYGNSLLLQMSIILLTLLVVLQAITNYWKISLHAAFNTGAVLVINFLFNWKLGFLFLTIPLIFWARLELKRHTISQLTLGFIIAVVIILSGLFLLGLI